MEITVVGRIDKVNFKRTRSSNVVNVFKTGLEEEEEEVAIITIWGMVCVCVFGRGGRTDCQREEKKRSERHLWQVRGHLERSS